MIFSICLTVGLIALLCSSLDAIGSVTVALMKYVAGPLLLLFCLAYIMKYGL